LSLPAAQRTIEAAGGKQARKKRLIGDQDTGESDRSLIVAAIAFSRRLRSVQSLEM